MKDVDGTHVGQDMSPVAFWVYGSTMNLPLPERSSVIDDIRENPEKHRHTFEELTQCCFVGGALDLALMEAHSQVDLGTNGGVRCDVTEGPCACGAWH